jgi:hypothetical protein
MKQQWPHKHPSPAWNCDRSPSPLAPYPKCLIRRQSAQLMGAGNDSKSAVALIASIEMDPHRQHVLKDGNRRLNEDLAFLLRPP